MERMINKASLVYDMDILRLCRRKPRQEQSITACLHKLAICRKIGEFRENLSAVVANDDKIINNMDQQMKDRMAAGKITEHVIEEYASVFDMDNVGPVRKKYDFNIQQIITNPESTAYLLESVAKNAGSSIAAAKDALTPRSHTLSYQPPRSIGLGDQQFDQCRSS